MKTVKTREVAEKLLAGLKAHSKAIPILRGEELDKAVFMVEHHFDVLYHSGDVLAAKGSFTVWWWTHHVKNVTEGYTKNFNPEDIELILKG